MIKRQISVQDAHFLLWDLKYCTSLVTLLHCVIQYYLFHVYKIICLKSIILKTPVFSNICGVFLRFVFWYFWIQNDIKDIPCVQVFFVFFALLYYLTPCGQVQFSSVAFSSVQCSSAQFTAVQLSSVQFISVQFNAVQLSSAPVQFSAVQFSSSSVQCSSAPVQFSAVQLQFSAVQLSAVQLSSVQLSSAQLGSAQLSSLPVLHPLTCSASPFYIQNVFLSASVLYWN